MKKANKILSVILAILMMFSIIPITASAATYSGTCGDNVTWSYDKTTCTLTISGSGEMYNYNFSNRPWEDYEDEIKTVIVSDGITLIGNYSFYHFDVLVSATLPGCLEKICNAAFASCKNLTEINIPDSVTELGDNAFKNSMLYENLTINKNVKKIGEYAFSYCDGIKSVVISSGKTVLDSHVFYNCDNITSVTLPDDMTEIPNSTFSSCIGLADVTLPDSIVRIGELAFHNTAYYNEETNWENGVLYLDEYLLRADSDSVSEDYEIKEGTKLIAEYAFQYCDNLVSVNIPESVKIIGKRAFLSCEKLTNINVNEDNQYFVIDEYGVLFNKEKTELILCPVGKKITDYTIPDTVTTIGKNAFYNCVALTSVILPDSIEVIDDSAFGYCDGITSLTIPDGVTTISYSAFRDCINLKDITIPESVTTIGGYAITIYKTIIHYVGTEAQWKQLMANNPEAEKNSLNQNLIYCSDNTVLPSGSCGDNLTWTFNIHTGVLTISGTGEMYDFEYSQHWDEVDSPWSIYTDYIKKVIIEDGVTSIGSYAFYECTNLSDVTIGDGVTTVGDHAFEACTGLNAITIGNGVTTIEQYAFKGCTGLTSIIIPIGVTSIDNYAFYNCSGVTDVYYEGTENQWYDYFVFSNWLNPPFKNATFHYNYGKGFTGIKDDYFYKDDVMQKAYQLVELDGDFYYIGDRHKIVKDKKVYIKAERTNSFTYADGTPITAGWYDFNADGKMIMLDGVIGNKIYKNGVQLKAYQLVKVGLNFYYIGDHHEIVRNQKVYVKAERTNGLTFADGTPIETGWYEFDENGRMIIYHGIVGDKVYSNGKLLKAYQLVQVNGDFYYIGDRHEIVKDKNVYVRAERTNGLTFADGTSIQAGWYNFDVDGKLIIE